MKCFIMKDLLPNYINGLTSEETNIEIRNHLDGCGHCRAIYEKMSEAVLQEVSSEENNIHFFKKLKAKMLRRNVKTAVLSCIVILGGSVIFAKNYYIPVSFDPAHMTVEVYKAAVLAHEGGYVTLENINSLGAMIPEGHGNIIDAVKLVYRGINNIAGDVVKRTVTRDGEEIKVYYYCYRETLWDSLFADPELYRGGEYRPINSNGFDTGDYEPQMREIYYLPAKNLDRLEKLSDEEYDKLREKSVLIWSGIS